MRFASEEYTDSQDKMLRQWAKGRLAKRKAEQKKVDFKAIDKLLKQWGKRVKENPEKYSAATAIWDGIHSKK